MSKNELDVMFCGTVSFVFECKIQGLSEVKAMQILLL